MYIINLGMYITEAMICKYLYQTLIRESVFKQGSHCDTFPRTKWSNKKCGKLPDKIAEEIPWNELCMVCIHPYVICRNSSK